MLKFMYNVQLVPQTVENLIVTCNCTTLLSFIWCFSHKTCQLQWENHPWFLYIIPFDNSSNAQKTLIIFDNWDINV